MPDQTDSGKPDPETSKESKEKKNFIKQRILKKTGSKNRTVIRILKIIFSAVLFGVVAVITAVLVRPSAVKYLVPTTIPVPETVQIPRDEPSSETETTTAAETTAPVTSSSGEKPKTEVKQIVQDVMESYPYSAKDLSRMYDNLKGIADDADKAIVAVSSVKTATDWFDNSVQTTGLYSGIVTAKTDSELLILTTDKAVAGADSLKVKFIGGSEMSAGLKRVDTGCGLAVISVSITDENRDFLKSVMPVILGNSYMAGRGDQLILTGSPQGAVHSVDYGFASYIARGVSVTDKTTDIIYTDALGNSSDGTWAFNIKSELIGWVTDAFRAGDTTGPTMIAGISDYKSILERMANGQASPLLGIRGTEVTKDLREQGMPAGIYVTDQEGDGPSYKAGIQRGDIIVSIGDTEMKTMKDYVSALDKLHAEDVVKITVKRSGRDTWTPIEFQVTVGARP